jgi:hypothetical protein
LRQTGEEKTSTGRDVTALSSHDTVVESRNYASLPRAVSSFGAAVADDWLYVYGGHCAAPHQYSTEAVVGTIHRIKLSNPGNGSSYQRGQPCKGSPSSLMKANSIRSAECSRGTGPESQPLMSRQLAAPVSIRPPAAGSRSPICPRLAPPTTRSSSGTSSSRPGAGRCVGQRGTGVPHRGRSP